MSYFPPDLPHVRPLGRRSRTDEVGTRPAWAGVAATAAVAAVVAGLGPPARPATTVRPGAPFVRVIVQATSTAAGQRAVRAAGGRVSRWLPIVHGVAGRVPAAALPALRRGAGVVAVTPDRRMTVAGAGGNGTGSSRSVYRQVVRADRLAAAGSSGAGVTVALLDTGIATNRDLSGRIVPVTDAAGRTSACENLSGESTCDDGYGHGTFLAGLIAGNGASSNGAYVGAAPSARLLSIKVGASDGSADVSNVLAGIQWAVSFREKYGIRVLNLSLGTDSTQSWTTDPLNYAVERAWAAGIVVVVSASNRGPASGTISKPADDPYVITVGATDDRQTVTLGDDRLPNFSGHGPTAEGVAKPDVVAPGAHVPSLRAVGSAIDRKFPTYIDATYRRGSGTSMAAAVVSGVAAAVLSARPDYTPDRLKYALTSTARPAADPSRYAVGAGVVDAFAAVSAPAGFANQGLGHSSGRGDLDASRGTVHVRTDDPLATVVSGTQTAQLVTWDPIGFLGFWNASTWYSSRWATARWLRTSWYGNDWSGHNWEGCSWNGAPESDCFYGHNWEGSVWYGGWD